MLVPGLDPSLTNFGWATQDTSWSCEARGRSWHIYVLRDPRDSAIRYCGWTGNPTRRLRHHINRCFREHSHKASWVVSLLRVGLKPVIEVVETGKTLKGHVEAEQRWIRILRKEGHLLTNLTDGGEGCLGLKHSAESIERSAAAHRGLVYPQEVREKVAAAGRGRKHSAETRAKMAASFTDERRARIAVQMSSSKRPETRARMAEAAKRRSKKSTGVSLSKGAT